MLQHPFGFRLSTSRFSTEVEFYAITGHYGRPDDVRPVNVTGY
jgi:hypothetical protein